MKRRSVLILSLIFVLVIITYLLKGFVGTPNESGAEPLFNGGVIINIDIFDIILILLLFSIIIFYLIRKLISFKK